jgi:hypothetical protein
MSSKHDISLQVLEFIELLSAFFVIVLSQSRVDAASGRISTHFCTNLSTYFVGGIEAAERERKAAILNVGRGLVVVHNRKASN